MNRNWKIDILESCIKLIQNGCKKNVISIITNLYTQKYGKINDASVFMKKYFPEVLYFNSKDSLYNLFQLWKNKSKVNISLEDFHAYKNLSKKHILYLIKFSEDKTKAKYYCHSTSVENIITIKLIKNKSIIDCKYKVKPWI